MCVKSALQYQGAQHSRCSGKCEFDSLCASKSPFMKYKVFTLLDNLFDIQIFHHVQMKSFKYKELLLLKYLILTS